MIRQLSKVLPLSALVLLAACESVPALDGARVGPYFKPVNFQGETAIPADIKRVVVLPLADNGKLQEEAMVRIDEVILQTINSSQRFECVPVTRDNVQRLAKVRSLRSVDALPADFLKELAADFGADAVLFVDITRYDPYPPIAIGIRAKLARLSDRSLVWSIDETYDGSKADVANAARKYWLDLTPPNTPTDMSVTALQSPTKFATYAFTSAFSTLPPRRK